jgi:hypothetical protein
METLEQRQLIRENYSLGREEAESRLSVALTDLQRQDLIKEGARRMRNTEDYAYSLSQGFWHTVSNVPLSLIEIEDGAVA